MSLISSAVSTSPSGESVFQLGRAIPCAFTARRQTCIRSTMMSGSGNGTLSNATTFGWCGVGENVATRTRTVASSLPALSGEPGEGKAMAPLLPSRDTTSVHVQGVSESSGSLMSPASSPRGRPAALPTSLDVDTLTCDVADRRLSAAEVTLSAVPERCGGDDAEPAFGGPTVLVRRLEVPACWLPSRTRRFFLPRVHMNRTSTAPSSGGERECRRSSEMLMCPIALLKRLSLDPLIHLRTIHV